MLPQQNGHLKNRITNLKFVNIEKRKDTKNLEFILKVSWSNGDIKTISRQYSMFFDLLGGLKLMFKDVAHVMIPELPVPKFQVTMLFSSLAKKESRVIEDFCQKLIRLPPVVTESDIVEKFFSVWRTDAVYSHDSVVKNPPISRPLPVDHRDDHVVEKYRAVASYQASSSGEMKMEENEILTVIEKNQTGWWLVTNDKGQHGFAPATFLEPLDPNRQSESNEWVDYDGDSSIWVALQPYTAQSIDEISYNKGDEVEVIATSSLGWWKVRFQGNIGITPASNLIGRSEQLTVEASVFENPIYDEAPDPRIRRASFTNVGTIYASIRKPPPRRDSSKKRMSADPRNALTLEYASISVANQSFLPSYHPSYNQDTTINDEPDSLYSTVLPKHLRQPKNTVAEQPKIEGIYEQVSDEAPPPLPICIVDETATLARRKDEEAAEGENQRPHSAEEVNSKNTQTHGYLNAVHGDERTNRTSLYKAVKDYKPPSDRPEDLPLQEGCVVRALTKDGAFFFVSTFDDSPQQGWVPENILENISQKSSSGHRRSRSLGDLIKQSSQSEESNVIAIKLQELHNRTPVAVPRSADKRRYYSFDATNEPNENLENAQNGHHHGSQEMACELHSLKVSSLAETESWFHGKMNRQTCEEQMLKNARELDFLIRESTQRIASYVLSVMFSKKVRHFPIETTPRKKFVIGKHAFDSLPAIVGFFTKHPLFYTQNREPVSLGQPFIVR